MYVKASKGKSAHCLINVRAKQRLATCKILQFFTILYVSLILVFFKRNFWPYIRAKFSLEKVQNKPYIWSRIKPDHHLIFSLSRNTVSTPSIFFVNGKVRFAMPMKTDPYDLNFNGFGFYYCAFFPFQALVYALLGPLILLQKGILKIMYL